MIKILGYLSGAAVVCGLLIAAGFYISPQDELLPADAIVVVSGGDTRARTGEAIELYQGRWAPLLIFSGAAEDPKSPSNAQVMRAQAIAQGVPPDVIAMEERSRNTGQNADEVAAIVKALKHKRIILVTSPYHQRRALIEFENRLKSDVTIINHSASDNIWSKRWWWATPLGWHLTLSELPKIALAWLSQQVL